MNDNNDTHEMLKWLAQIILLLLLLMVSMATVAHLWVDVEQHVLEQYGCTTKEPNDENK